MNAPQKPKFSLAEFELQVHRRQYEAAARSLLQLLNMLDAQYGAWGDIGTRPSNDRSKDRRDRHIINRTTSAIGALFADPDFKLTLGGWGRSLFYQRWLQILFGACDFTNSDYVLHLMKADGGTPAQMTYDDPALIKFSLLYFGDSQIPLRKQVLWNKNPQFAAGLFMAILSSRLVISDAAMKKKETLLEWLPDKIKNIELTDAHIPFLHDVWMHCSYAFTPRKHDIKESLNLLFKRRLLAAGCKEPEMPARRYTKKKPTLLVPLEWFTSKHAMYRCYSPRVASLKERFHVVALASEITIDDVSKKIFDDVIVIKRGNVIEQARNAAESINELKPDVIYYPSIGMQLMTVALATMRLAPVQCMGLGHPATSRSKEIDYVIARQGTVKDPTRFSEKIILMPDESMPLTLPHNVSRVEPIINPKPEVVKIAITASVMKINPILLKACQSIYDASSQPVQFHFFVGHGIGITRHYITNMIDQFLSDSIVHPHSEYDKYIEKLNVCDMFINPFPFGNSNGIVDTVRQGLPGICLDGPEVHSHLDAMRFQKLGLPDWTIAKNVNEYIQAAVRMAKEHDVRTALSNELLSSDPDQKLFEGDTSKFCESMYKIYKQHKKIMKNPAQMLELSDLPDK